MFAPEFWTRRGVLSTILSPLGHLYGTATSWRAARQPRWTADVPVICVGNAVLGGAGKTPVCLDLVQRLSRHGWTPHVLSRGYGGKLSGPILVNPSTHTFADVGDEPLLLARHAPTWVGIDRIASAKRATQDGADILLLDDGFQNPTIAKDLSFLVMDGRTGNGRIFPAGPLREPLNTAITRTDALVAFGEEHPHSINPKPLFSAKIEPNPDAFLQIDSPVVAFAGIGHPPKFFETAKSIGFDICASHPFPDHHPYSDADLEMLIKSSERHDAKLLTTEKDFVRLPSKFAPLVAVLGVHVKWDDEQALDTFLRRELTKA